MASIRDVAKRANVSVATVSRVLNGSGRVTPALRERVEQAISELHYTPSGIARNMRSQSIRTIGLIISDIQNPFFTALVRAVEDVAYENQYTVLLCNSDQAAEKEKLYIDVLTVERVTGLVIVPTSLDPTIYTFKRPIPLVLVDRVVPGLSADAVMLDNVAGAYKATTHLIELGHRRIGLIIPPPPYSMGVERQQGYTKALLDYGLPVDDSLIRSGDSPKEVGGYQATRELLALDPPPTAIFAANNVRTIGALQAIQEAGLRIPEQISVVGFDDSPWLSLLSPPLTTVCQPTYDIGAQAAGLLLRRLQTGWHGPPQTVVLQSELIVRSSTAPLS